MKPWQLIALVVLLLGAGVVPLIVTDNSLQGNASTANPLKVNTSVIQKRVTGTCGGGSAVGSVNADGSVNCNGAGGVTSVATTAPVTGGPITSTGTISLSFLAPLINSGGSLTCQTFGTGSAGCVPASGGVSTNCLHADGTWAACGSGGGGGTPSIAIVDAASPSTLNLSTEGTIDWFYEFTTGASWLTAPTSIHSKLHGGWLMLTCWGQADGASTSTASLVPTFSSTAADDTSNSALSSATFQVFFGAVTKMGWQCRIPVPPGVQRVARAYVSVFGCTITATGLLSVSGTTASDAFTIGGVQTNKKITYTATGGADGDELILDFRCTTNPGSGSLSFGAITLAPT